MIRQSGAADRYAKNVNGRTITWFIISGVILLIFIGALVVRYLMGA